LAVTQFRRTWVWSRRETELYAKFITGTCLHVCCGESRLGDVRVDVRATNNVNVLADMARLPFRDLSFDTAIWDPPWIHPKNFRAVFELARVARKRVLVISNHWVHVPKPFMLKEVYAVKKVSPAVKLFFVYNREENGCLSEEEEKDVRRAMAEIKHGEGKTFNNVEDALEWLKK
jgi:hypothetical protein